MSAARDDATKRGAIWKINLMGVGLVEHKIKMTDEQLMPILQFQFKISDR